MKTIQIATFNKYLTNGSVVIFDKPKYNFTKTISLTGNIKCSLSGTCDGYQETTIPITDTYILSDSNEWSKTFTFTHKCSSLSVTTKIKLLDYSPTQYQLISEFISNTRGQTFITGDFISNVYLTSVNMNLPTYTLNYPASPANVTYTIKRNVSLAGSLGIIVDNPSTAGTATIYYGDSITIDANRLKFRL